MVLIFLSVAVITGWRWMAQAASGLTADFDHLSQAQITAAMGAGWNLGNTLEAFNDYGPNEEAWGNPKVTPELFAAVKNAGFKTVRIPVTLLKAIGRAPDYTIDPVWLARVKEVVDYAYNQGLFVILDGVHGDGYHTIKGAWLLVTDSDQTAVRDKYQKIWKQYAETFKDYDEHLIFESMNEVFDGNYYDPDYNLYQNLNAYNQIFVDTVRQTGGNNAARWLLIPGWNTNIDHMTLDFGFVIPTDNYRSAAIPSNEKRLMLSAHYYSPYEFTLDNSGQITQWGVIASDSSRKVNWCQEDYMDTHLAQMYSSFVTQGYPVVIGEYCATDKTDKDSTNNIYRVYFNKMLSTTCKKYGAVPVYWDIGVYGPGGSGIIDRRTYKIVEPEILEAIISGINANVTPPSPTSPTPTPVGPGVKVSILYKCGATDAKTNGIRFSFQVRNDDTVIVPLSSVKVRYWYTRDDGKWQSFNCYYAALGSGNVYGNMVRLPLSSALETADFYAETGFYSGAGSLLPGATSGEVQITLTKYDNSNYNQSNDYSFNPNLTAYSENMRITAYVNGVLVFGTEPTGTTPPTPINTLVPTPTPSPTPSNPVITSTPSNPVVTPTPTPVVTQEPEAFSVTYTQNHWGTGATVNITIKNNGTTTINGWKLDFTFPGNQKISHLWCGKYTQNGAAVTVTNESYNGIIAPGGTANFGFNINYNGTNDKPTSFTVNGVVATIIR